MTIDELRNKWNTAKEGSPVMIQHLENKTVRFWPTSLTLNEGTYEMNGFWIGIQVDDIIAPECIKIKHGDLKNWYIVENNG